MPRPTMLSNNDGDGGRSFLAAYTGGPVAQIRGLGPMVRRPSGAVLHSSREPGVYGALSDFMNMLRRLIIVIIIITPQRAFHFAR